MLSPAKHVFCKNRKKYTENIKCVSLILCPSIKKLQFD
jgi:hypothetical protein